MATERILPAIALPAPARPRLHREAPAFPGAITRPARPAVQAPARPAVRRREGVLSTPTRAGMLIGASAAIYAVSLAGVAAIQSQSDAAVAAQRAPYLDAISAARAANDSLEAALLSVDAQARALAADYAQAGDDVSAYQARLDALAALVADVQGSVAALPSHISLPKVTMRGAVGGSGRAPATTARSGASGVP